jgi:serine protease AprX
MVSLRDPGSYADAYFPAARVDTRYFKGSGSSQAAAVTSGAIALLLQKYPTASPDDIRTQLRKYATKITGSATAVGAGELNIGAALATTPAPTVYVYQREFGTGSLNASRGTMAITFGTDTTPLTGEKDIFGAFTASTWASQSFAQNSWVGGDFMGHPWTGTAWTTATDGQANWSGRAWSGRAWSGRAWSDIAWAGATWSAGTWTSTIFNGAAWAGATWEANTWCGGTKTSHWLM